MPPKLNKVIRLDSLPLGQTFYTSEGYLRDRPILTRTGIFEYTNPDGSIRRELRLPEDVFAQESLESYRGRPIVITHDAGLINKDNVAKNQIGTILSDGYRDGENVRAEIVIHNTDAMKDSRMKELSLGYNLDLEETPGEWNGQHYDAIQRNIRINHLALVEEARAGDKARLNIDGRVSKTLTQGGNSMNKNSHQAERNDGILTAAELEEAIAEYKAKRTQTETKEEPVKDAQEEPAVEVTHEAPKAPVLDTPPEEKPTVEEEVAEIKGKNADADEDMQKLFDIIDTLLAERDFKAAEEKPAEEKADCGRKDAEGDELPGETEETGEEVVTDEAEAPEAVEPTEALNTDSIDKLISAKIAVGMLGRQLNMDGLETMPLMDAKKSIIKAVRPNLNLDGKSASYINAVYDMACDEVKSQTEKGTDYQKQQMFSKPVRDDAADGDSAEKARERYIARMRKNKEDK